MEATDEFQVLAKLAKGGMAELFLARKVIAGRFERYVVLKRVLPDHAHDQRFVAMFLDEVRLAAQLQHPNIAQVHDVGKLGDSYFFTMEYVHGETVRALLRAHPVVPIGCALAIVVGAAGGLHHAHERIGLDGRPLGIVHRDVTPSNLVISFEGNVKVVDFGIAKAADRITETRSGLLKGKISYLSPEQCRMQALDRRSDLFSLGIVMWELLTGKRMYRRDSDFESMEAIVNEDAAPPSSRRPEVTPELDHIVLRLLAKEPDQRYATAADAIEDIESAAVKAGIAISTLALARFMRDVFGQRPEPWIELAERPDTDEVRVRTEPAANEPSRPAPSPVEAELAAVAELAPTMPHPLIQPEPEPEPEPEAATTPAPVLAVERRRVPDWRWIAIATVAVSALVGAVIGTCTGRDNPRPPPPTPQAAVREPALPDPAPPPDAAPEDHGQSDDQIIELDPDDSAKITTAAIAHKDSSHVEAELVRMFDRNRLDEIGTRCASLPATSGRIAMVCALTACQKKNERAARQWVNNAPANKHSVLKSRCRELGVVLDSSQR